MTVGTIGLLLQVGPLLPPPAPDYLMRALRGVEVTQNESAPSGFQLTFLAEDVAAATAFGITADPLLQPFNRVLVWVLIDGVPFPLIDGFITHQQFVPANGPDDSIFVVTGEDFSVQMDLVERSSEYPAMDDLAIVELLLAPWIAHDVAPMVLPPANLLVPVEYVPQQASSDRAFLQELARNNGYVFFMRPLEVPFTNVAYWGPPPRIGVPQAVLDVAVGVQSTADQFAASYDALAPETFAGLSIETDLEPFVALPVATVVSMRLPPLAIWPALNPLTPSRRSLWRDDELDPERALLRAQALTDRSTDDAVQVTASFSAARLGTVVCAPGLVGVRGAGFAYDGYYYAKSATHRIGLVSDAGWDYTQELTLTREGLGTTTPIVEAS